MVLSGLLPLRLTQNKQEPCHEDKTPIKYYIKSESESYGLYTSFLKENDDKTLNWTTMTTAEASLNDSAAWYVTFNPKTCYYTFTNVATKDQIAYTSGVFKAKANAATTESRLQLMRGRVDVVSGFEPRGYYLARPENVASPHCLGASANNKVSPLTFNYANTQSRLRWLILTEEEAQQLDAIHQATGIVKVVNDQTVEKRTFFSKLPRPASSSVSDIARMQLNGTPSKKQACAAAAVSISQHRGSKRSIMLSRPSSAMNTSPVTVLPQYIPTVLPISTTSAAHLKSGSMPSGW